MIETKPICDLDLEVKFVIEYYRRVETTLHEINNCHSCNIVRPEIIDNKAPAGWTMIEKPPQVEFDYNRDTWILKGAIGWLCPTCTFNFNIRS